MEFSLFFLAFTMFWNLSHCLRCYKCEPQISYYTGKGLPCEHFDGTDKFMTECPYSTLCYKKETLLVSLGATTKSTERGCAKQTRYDEQIKVNGSWRFVNNIYEVYPESCKEASLDSGTPTKTVQCYCRGELCNHASHRYLSYVTGVMLTATLWILC